MHLLDGGSGQEPGMVAHHPRAQPQLRRKSVQVRWFTRFHPPPHPPIHWACGFFSAAGLGGWARACHLPTGYEPEADLRASQADSSDFAEDELPEQPALRSSTNLITTATKQVRCSDAYGSCLHPPRKCCSYGSRFGELKGLPSRVVRHWNWLQNHGEEQ